MATRAKYATEEVLDKKLSEYWKEWENERKTPNKAGLRLYLDIGRTQYNEYKKKYPNTIKKVEDYIENWWIELLTRNGCTGAIFYLKNAFKEDYKDRHETDITTGGEKIFSWKKSK